MNRAFEQLSIPALSDILHPDYIHVTRPRSINVPKAQTLEFFGQMFSNWASAGPVVYEVLVNTPGKIVIHLTSEVTLKSGPTVTFESCASVEFADDPSGNKKFKHTEEFIDAKAFAQGFTPYLTAKA